MDLDREALSKLLGDEKEESTMENAEAVGITTRLDAVLGSNMEQTATLKDHGNSNTTMLATTLGGMIGRVDDKVTSGFPSLERNILSNADMHASNASSKMGLGFQNIETVVREASKQSSAEHGEIKTMVNSSYQLLSKQVGEVEHRLESKFTDKSNDAKLLAITHYNEIIRRIDLSDSRSEAREQAMENKALKAQIDAINKEMYDMRFNNLAMGQMEINNTLKHHSHTPTPPTS